MKLLRYSSRETTSPGVMFGLSLLRHFISLGRGTLERFHASGQNSSNMINIVTMSQTR